MMRFLSNDRSRSNNGQMRFQTGAGSARSTRNKLLGEKEFDRVLSRKKRTSTTKVPISTSYWSGVPYTKYKTVPADPPPPEYEVIKTTFFNGIRTDHYGPKPTKIKKLANKAKEKTKKVLENPKSREKAEKIQEKALEKGLEKLSSPSRQMWGITLGAMTGIVAMAFRNGILISVPTRSSTSLRS